MSELNINSTSKSRFENAEQARLEYSSQIKEVATNIISNETIDISTLHALDQQLDQEWSIDGFNKEQSDFNCSVVDSEGRLIKIIALGLKQKTLIPDPATLPTIARVFIAGDQRDVTIPSFFRPPDMNLRDGSIQNHTLYTANNQRTAKIMSSIEARSSTSQEVLNALTNQINEGTTDDNFQWLISQLGDRVSTAYGSDILRTSNTEHTGLAVIGIGFSTLLNAKSKTEQAEAEDEAWEMHTQATETSKKIKKKLFESATSLAFRQLAAFRESMNDQSKN